jgi:Dolichyl-phosphate-mannose-protein mannosyltransferase
MPGSPNGGESRERFLNGPMAIGFALYGLFAVTFAYFQVQGDALVYFNLLRRFFGEEPDFAYAYQFGSAVWNTPFFLVGKTFGILFGFQPRIFHVSFEEISITLATQAAFVLTLYLGWRILRELGLPRGPDVLFLTVFGTPLFFYVIFDPAGKHAVDTLVLTAATYAFLRCDSASATRAAVVLGALCGWSLNIRWANVAFFGALLFALLVRRRRRPAALATGTAAGVAIVILALPAFRGIEYFFPIVRPLAEAASVVHVAAGAGELVAPVEVVDDAEGGSFDPTIPARMLFSDHRGLFLWTPLTALAAIGFGLAFARGRGTAHGYFLSSLLAAALALLAIHVFWPRWDGGFAFSQRFLTGLFPLFLIGVAELVRRVRWRVYPALALAAAFSVAVAFVHDIGYDGSGSQDDLSRVVEAGYENRSQMRLDVQNDAKARWVYLWGLLNGRDPKCIAEPPGTTEC